MTLLIATQDGVYRSQSGDLDDVEQVLDSGVVLSVQTFEEHGTFAASKTGLYRSTDGEYLGPAGCATDRGVHCCSQS